VSDHRDAAVNLPLVAAIVGVATIGGFMFGYDSGVINGTQEGLRTSFGLSEAWLGITVSALLPGCALGAFIAGRSADRWGRRRVMVASAVLFILSALAAGAAGSALMMIVARFAAGIGVGAASVLSPAYISEVTPAGMRGRLSSLQQVMIIAGLTGAFLANYFLALKAGKSTDILWLGYAAWRWMFWMQIIPAGVFFVTLLLIPESPRYLVARGSDEEARVVLTRKSAVRSLKTMLRGCRISWIAKRGGCGPSSGWGWGLPCSSSSWESMSCSITAPCSGRRWDSAKRTRSKSIS
jgi:MFS transporter, SP family, sugar:H+ symporter